MPQGLQCFDENNNTILDITYRLTKYLGTVYTNGASGSITDEQLTQGTPWVHASMVGNYAGAGLVIVVSGSTLSWSYSVLPRNQKLIYGVY